MSRIYDDNSLAIGFPTGEAKQRHQELQSHRAGQGRRSQPRLQRSAHRRQHDLGCRKERQTPKDKVIVDDLRKHRHRAGVHGSVP